MILNVYSKDKKASFDYDGTPLPRNGIMADILNGFSNTFNQSYTWLVTGVGGFIGSNLLEYLLKLDQNVVGLDNFSTGTEQNLQLVKHTVEERQWKRFKLVEGDIRNKYDCLKVCKGIDFVLHQAALGSVPRSINDPQTTNEVNIDGFLNLLIAARECNVKSFTYAASSSTYGDSVTLPKTEEVIGRPLSPYAITKYVNELYADVFARTYGFNCIGLRYFNVFGGRQDPCGAYAAVIPRWSNAMLNGEPIEIFGDGQTSRDFCYVKNVVQANLRAATAKLDVKNEVYNIAAGERTTLLQLFDSMKYSFGRLGVQYAHEPIFKNFRQGDVRHSQADITKARKLLGYEPVYKIKDGLEETLLFFLQQRELNNGFNYINTTKTDSEYNL